MSWSLVRSAFPFVVAGFLAGLVGGVCKANAQVIVTGQQFFPLPVLTNRIGSYQTIAGSGSFGYLALNRLSPLSFSARAYAIAQFSQPGSPPSLPFSQVALVRSGVRVVQASLTPGEPDWYAGTVDGVPVFTLFYPFSVAFSVPYSPAALPVGDYEVHLLGGPQPEPVLAFSLAPDTKLPALKLEALPGSIRLSWEDSTVTDFIGVEESSRLPEWKSIGTYLRSKGSITVPASDEAKFYRLNATLR